MSGAAKSYRGLLESIGCWPPTCHGCGAFIEAEEMMMFKAIGSLFAGMHERCSSRTPAAPTPEVLKKQDAARRGSKEKSGGAYVTAEEMRDWHP